MCEERTVEHVRGQVLPVVSRKLSLMTSRHRHDVISIGEVTTAFIERHAHKLTNALVLQTLDKGEIPRLPSGWEAIFQLQFGQCSYARRAKSGAIEEKSWKRPTVDGVEFPWSWLRRPIPPPNYGTITAVSPFPIKFEVETDAAEIDLTLNPLVPESESEPEPEPRHYAPEPWVPSR